MEFAVFYWYAPVAEYHEHGALSNFTTGEPYRSFDGGLFDALATLSGEGWHIVHADPLLNSYPPQRLIWLQRPKVSEGS